MFEGIYVEADLYATFLVAGALVPLAALPSTGPLLPTAVGTGAPDATTTSSSTTTIISDPLPTLPNPPPATTSQHLPLENDGAKAFFTSLIALMIAFNIAGSLFNAKNAISGASPDLSTAVVAGTSRLSYCSALYPGSLAGTPLSINSLLQSALECIKAVDPFFLLFHFQFTSFSGMFSLAYPPQYQGFTYNFLFANLFVPIPSFEQSQVAGRGLCWGMIDPEAVRKYGFFSLAGRFGVAVYALGGIVYLCILCALAILIALGVIIWLILWVIEMWWKRRARKCNLGHRSYAVYRELRQRWPAIAYDLLLRLVSKLESLCSNSQNTFRATVPLDLGVCRRLRVLPVYPTPMWARSTGRCTFRVLCYSLDAHCNVYSHRARSPRDRWRNRRALRQGLSTSPLFWGIEKTA